MHFPNIVRVHVRVRVCVCVVSFACLTPLSFGKQAAPFYFGCDSFATIIGLGSQSFHVTHVSKHHMSANTTPHVRDQSRTLANDKNWDNQSSFMCLGRSSLLCLMVKLCGCEPKCWQQLSPSQCRKVGTKPIRREQ